MSKITYLDKVALNKNPDIPDINKVKADDMNEIKNVVNGLVKTKKTISDEDTYACNYINENIKKLENMQNYSTDEIVIGTWFDKTLYRKVIETTTASSVSSWKTLTSGLNADEIFSYAGNIKYSQNETKLLPFSTGNSAIYFQKNETTNELQEAHTGDDLNSKNMKVVIEYTKITD